MESRGIGHGVPMCEVACAADSTSAANFLLTDRSYEQLAMLFEALADHTRARIVHMLLQQELCTCDIADILGITDSAVSQHLKILRVLRLVKSRRDGKFVYYSLDDAHIALLIQVGLTHLREQEGEIERFIPAGAELIR